MSNILCCSQPPAVVRATPEERLQDSGSDVTSQAVAAVTSQAAAAAEASGSDVLTVTVPCRQVNTVACRLNQHLNQLLVSTVALCSFRLKY